MKSKALIRTLIIVVVIAGLGFAGYTFFIKNKDAKPAGSLQTTGGAGAGNPATTNPSSATANLSVGQDFLTLLLNVQSIKLDEKLFTSKAFTVLQDYNRPIPPDVNPGRVNPFAPLGADGVAVSTQVSTSAPSSITATASTLNGTLGFADPTTTRWFEYGPSAALGSMTTPRNQPVPGAFAEVITGLSPNTTYYVKASASINGVTVSGNVVTWKTAQSASSFGKPPQ